MLEFSFNFIDQAILMLDDKKYKAKAYLKNYGIFFGKFLELNIIIKIFR